MLASVHEQEGAVIEDLVSLAQERPRLAILAGVIGIGLI